MCASKKAGLMGPGERGSSLRPQVLLRYPWVQAKRNSQDIYPPQKNDIVVIAGQS